MSIDAGLAARFRGDVEALLSGPPGRLGIAVSGGVDSLALLLLAAAAWPQGIEAATVDHALRPEAADEARQVAAICARLGIAHAVLRLDWPDPPAANLQARARAARYAALGEWARGRGIAHLATGHHADDQAETVLMRLARGAGLGGLAGARRARPLLADAHLVTLIRPLLGWRRAELAAIVAAAGLEPLEDPSNADERFDRTRARALLVREPWLDAGRLAATAHHLAEAEEALAWSARALFAERHARDGGSILLDARNLPQELQRRLLVEAMRQLGASDPAGPKVARLIEQLNAGGTATLAGLRIEGGGRWRLAPAPPPRPAR